MTEDIHEALSAFVDGEVSGDADARLLDKVLKDDTLSRRWVSYHLIGDVIRRHADVQGLAGPVVSITADDGRPRPGTRAPASIRPVGGLALAASVALVAILGFQALSTRDVLLPEDDGIARTAAVGSVPSQGDAALIAETGGPEPPRPVVKIPADRLTAAASSMRSMTRQTWSDAGPAVADRLNGYLLTHNEHLANGLRGMHPYARIVAYDGRGN